MLKGVAAFSAVVALHQELTGCEIPQMICQGAILVSIETLQQSEREGGAKYSSLLQ